MHVEPNTPAGGPFVLPSRLDLTNAGALRDVYLANEGDLTLDASVVEIVSTAGLQVMMAGRDWLVEQGHAVEIDAPSRGFVRCLTELGTTIERLTSHPAKSGGQ